MGGRDIGLPSRIDVVLPVQQEKVLEFSDVGDLPGGREKCHY